MLCVSAVNPFLYTKVPSLQHVMGVRKKLGNMLQYVRCPFRRAIDKGLGPRRYLLESNDFFALRDLIDLSKGPFAGLLKLKTFNLCWSKEILQDLRDHINFHVKQVLCFEISWLFWRADWPSSEEGSLSELHPVSARSVYTPYFWKNFYINS